MIKHCFTQLRAIKSWFYSSFFNIHSKNMGDLNLNIKVLKLLNCNSFEFFKKLRILD